jgi:hypothetical protein
VPRAGADARRKALARSITLQTCIVTALEHRYLDFGRLNLAGIAEGIVNTTGR